MVNAEKYIRMTPEELINLMFDERIESVDFLCEVAEEGIAIWHGVKLLDPFDHWLSFPDTMLLGDYGFGTNEVILLNACDESGEEIAEEQDARRMAIRRLKRYVCAVTGTDSTVLVGPCMDK